MFNQYFCNWGGTIFCAEVLSLIESSIRRLLPQLVYYGKGKYGEFKK